MKYFENYQDVIHRYEVSECYWKSGANRLA